MANPWQMTAQPSGTFSLQDSPVPPEKLAQIGIHAMMTGKVSLKDAKANAKKVGLDPKLPTDVKGKAAKLPPGQADAGMLTQDKAAWDPAQALSMTPQATPESNPFDMSVMNQPGDLSAATAGTPDRKGAYETVGQESQRKTDRKVVTNTNLSKSPEQTNLEMMLAQGITPKTIGYRRMTDPQTGEDLGEDRSKPLYDLNDTTTDENSPYQQQMQGLKHLAGMNEAQAQANAQKSHLDLTPLLALSDSFKNVPGMQTHFTDSYKAPASGANEVMAGADEIQKRRGDLQKSLYENVKNMKGGTLLEQLAQYDALKNTVGAGQKNPTADPAALMEQRNTNRAYMQLVGQIKRDKPLTQMFTQYGNINNALSNIANATHVTPQNIDEFQQALRANLGIKGSSGVGERDKTMLNSIGLNADRIAQFLQGKPSDIAHNDQLVRHLQQLAALESANIQDQSAKRLRMAAGGYSYILDDPRYDYLNKSLKELTGATQAQFQPTSLVSRTQGKVGGVPSQSSVRKSAVPAGAPKGSPQRTKPLDQMSQAELDAYEASLKAGH